MLETQPIVMHHYRQQARAQGYTGDSILTSVSDKVAMMLGVGVAWRLPVWAVVALGLGLEVFVSRPRDAFRAGGAGRSFLLLPVGRGTRIHLPYILANSEAMMGAVPSPDEFSSPYCCSP